MSKSTSDTFKDLLGGVTDDLKEAFDDIIDYGEHDRRRDRDRWRHREDDGRRHDRDRDHWRHREDDGRWGEWDRDRWRQREDDGRRHDRDYRRAVDIPRQSRRGERSEQDDLRESVQALRSELHSFVEALRETSAARRPEGSQETRGA